MTCKECQFARYTKAKGFVGCLKAFTEIEDERRLGDEEFTDEYRERVFNTFAYRNRLSGGLLGYGWVYAQRYPDSSDDGTVGFGHMVNNYPCVPEDASAICFQIRENHVQAA